MYVTLNQEATNHLMTFFGLHAGFSAGRGYANPYPCRSDVSIVRDKMFSWKIEYSEHSH